MNSVDSGPQSAAATRNYLPALDALRGLAAVLVASSHISVLLYGEDVRNGSIDINGFSYLLLTRAGPFGVEVFFFLSGFVMVYTTRFTKLATSDFLLRRIARIVPLYWICLVTFWLSIAPASLPVDILKSAFLLPRANSDPPYFGYSTLIVAWTLSYEVLFYGFFALAMRLSSRRLSTSAAVTLMLATSVLGLQLWLVGSITLVPGASPMMTGLGELRAIVGMLANPLLLNFAVGALAGQAYLACSACPTQLTRNARRLRAAIAALLVATPVLYLVMPSQHGMFGVGLSALCMFAAFAITDLLGDPFNSIVARRMGQWSYGIYLVHPIVGLFIDSQFPGFWRGLNPIGAYLLFFSVTLALAAILHVAVERPFMNLARRKSAQSN